MVIDTEKLKELRGNRSLQDVAEVVGVTKQQIWNYENGISDPPLDKLIKLLAFYGVNFQDVVKEKFLPAA